VSTVNTKKYQIATEKGIPIMVQSWINETWKANQRKFTSALDEPLSLLKCPPFLALNITLSQFSQNEKEKLIAIIEKNGLYFLSSLRDMKYSHLLFFQVENTAEIWKHILHTFWWLEGLQVKSSLTPSYAR
jgi:hypothetical protein